MLRDIDQLLDQLGEIESKGGPTPDEYSQVMRLFDAIAAARGYGRAEEPIRSFIKRSPSFSTTRTMHGFVCVRPHGYAGDFEIIDRIYRRHVSEDCRHTAWDHFFHAGDAAKAVRARKAFCVNLFNHHALRLEQGAEILNVASGPCRDVLEFKSQGTQFAELSRVHCVDMDENAIAYASKLLNAYRGITFERRNVLRAFFEPKYDLVWSGGLFDYFNDRVFVTVLKRLYAAVRPGGELVVGNFSPLLSTRSYMEFGDWRLNYRDATRLRELAEAAEATAASIVVDSEEMGLNLFLRLQKPCESTDASIQQSQWEDPQCS
jgi:extracellular factor (EF) 3-hydroxypalmitic acid methyl ester biosynthesis protein